MPAPEYSASLRGLTINLVVDDIDSARIFHTKVLGATVVYADPDVAVLSHGSAQWMLHAAHTCDQHPLLARETYLLDGDGYLWVPDVLLSAD
jgi:catechol 2,3-dioxygenase-like lactoylglutathione lyase family enzyme